jgi:NAD(P)-dependent dehydrogenase (short-subunit alcohol dehydrogenase family)
VSPAKDLGAARQVTGTRSRARPRTVSFLASEDAGFITGQRIVVDGGPSLGS